MALTVSPGAAWFFFFLILPLLSVVIASFASRGVYGEIQYQWNIENYVRVWDPIIAIPLLRSLVLSISTTLLALLLSIPTCLFIASHKRATQNLLLLLIALPFWSNFLVRTYAWVAILRGDGFLNQTLMSLGLLEDPLDLLFRWDSVLIGLLYVYLPFMLFPVYTSVEKLDRRLLSAAADLGASRFQIFVHVLLPLIRPGVRTGIVFVSIMTFGDFVIADILGGGKFSLIGNVIKDQYLTARNWPFGSALSLCVVCGALFALKLTLDVFLPKRGELS